MPETIGSPLVLVVNDDPSVGEETATNLRRVGLRVRTALTSGFALDLCQDLSFDGVVLDLPLADPYSEILLNDDSDLGLAVIVSAMPDQLALMTERCQEKVFALVAKPVTQSELIPVVQGAVTEFLRRCGDEQVRGPNGPSETHDVLEMRKTVVEGTLKWMGTKEFFSSYPDELLSGTASTKGEAFLPMKDHKKAPHHGWGARRPRTDAEAPHHRRSTCDCHGVGGCGLRFAQFTA